MTDEPQTGADGAPSRRRRLGVPQVRKPGSPRTIVHKVKVTEDQEYRLVVKAAERDITVSRLLVESALSGGSEAAKTKAVLASELFRVVRLLGKVSVNINQIARATNATLEKQPDTAPAIQALGRVCERLTQLLEDMDYPVGDIYSGFPGDTGQRPSTSSGGGPS
jgi:hypothetical protein